MRSKFLCLRRNILPSWSTGEDGRGRNQSLWLYPTPRHRVMISINEAISPLQCVGGGSERAAAAFAFFPYPSVLGNSTQKWSHLSFPSSSNPLPRPLLHYARARDARAGRRAGQFGLLPKSRRVDWQITRQRGRSPVLRAHPLPALPHFQQNSTTSLAHTSTSIPATATATGPTRATP